MNLIEEAKGLAKSRGMATEADIDLLAEALGTFKERPPSVVLIGAGSGTFTLAIFGAAPMAYLSTVDHSEEAGLYWERKVLENVKYGGNRHKQIFSRSEAAGKGWKGDKIDLLLVDGDHSYEGVVRDLNAWLPHVRDGGLVFLHDYDAKDAPEYSPGVANAANGLEPRLSLIEKRGWSGLFEYDASATPQIKQSTVPEKQSTPQEVDSTPQKTGDAPQEMREATSQTATGEASEQPVPTEKVQAPAPAPAPPKKKAGRPRKGGR